MKIWESKPPGTFWATLGLLWGSVTLIFYITFITDLVFEMNPFPLTTGGS